MNSPLPMYLGLDVGGTKSAAVIGDQTGQILAREQIPSFAARGSAPLIDDLCNMSHRLLRAHPTVAAVGVSIGGPLNANDGIILSPPNLPGWDNIPLKSILQNRLQLPTIIEHDAAACALAEYYWGAGRGASRLIYLTCGTGFGAGLVFDGQIYRGAAGRNVEIGHSRLRDDGPLAFEKAGSAESFCAASALGKIAAWKFPDKFPTAPDPKQIADLAATGDSNAIEVITINAHAVGQVCANLADLLRPDVILLGSLAAYLGQTWLAAVQSRFNREALVPSACRVIPAGLGPRLQDCSALVVAVAFGRAAK